MPTNKEILEQNKLKRQQMSESGVIPTVGTSDTPTGDQKLAPTTPNHPVVSPQQTTPPQTMTGVNGENFQVAPVNPQTGLSQPEQTQAPTTPPVQEVKPIEPVKPVTPTKIEAPIDYTQAKGREQDIITNLESFKAKGMTPDQIMRASGYAEATPEKKALIEPYLKQTQPTSSSMFNALVSKVDIPDEQKVGTGYKIAQNRYLKANMYSSMTPSQVSQAMTDAKLIEGSQTWEDLKTLNPKLAQDVQNLRIINGSKPNVFKYINNPYGTTVKENQLEKQFTQDYLDDYGDFLRSIYTVQTPEQIRAAIYTPDVQAAQDKATEIELELAAIEKDIDSVDKDIESELAGTGATGSRIRLEKATRAEKLQNLYNSTLKQYTAYANKANNLITQNTAVYKSQQDQQTALQNALAGAAKSKYEGELALQQEQESFDQKIRQQAQMMNDPNTAISTMVDEYKKLGVPFERSTQQIIADFQTSGIDLPTYLTNLQKTIQSKPEYKAMQAYQMSQYAPKETTPFQLANLGDGRAIMYNQATGEYQQINAGAVQTASQSPSTIAQYSQQARGKTNLQCGELVNDYWTQFTGNRAGMGDTYQSKLDAINKAGKSDTPQVGGMFVLDTGTSTGHTGIVTGVNGNQITVLEANRAGKKEGEPPVENTYTISDKFTFSNPPSTGTTGTQYTAAEEAWANNIMNGKAKLSDITNKDNIDKSKVLQIINQKSGGTTGAAQTNLSEGLDIVNRLINHPGFEAAVGVPSLWTNPFGYSLPSSDARDFKAELERFKAIGFLNMIPQMQGMGALSNAEGSKLAAAYSKLSETGISEKAYKEELERLKTGMETALSRMGMNTQQTSQLQNTNTGAGLTLENATNDAINFLNQKR